MKYLIEFGNHEYGKWVVVESSEHESLHDARQALITVYLSLVVNTCITDNVKLVDTGEDNPNKQPKHYHYITKHYPKPWWPMHFR